MPCRGPPSSCTRRARCGRRRASPICSTQSPHRRSQGMDAMGGNDMYAEAEILVVEDSPTQATELQYMLESVGCKVRVAHNGREALEMVAVRRPTIVISDI